MTIEDQIAALLLEAEPLRLLPEDEKEAAGLPALVDRINRLRALPPGPAVGLVEAVEPAKRGPGRPKKAE